MTNIETRGSNKGSIYPTYEDRKKPFLRWAKRNAPGLYDSLTKGRVVFKDKWLAQVETAQIVSKEEGVEIAKRKETIERLLDDELPF